MGESHENKDHYVWIFEIHEDVLAWVEFNILWNGHYSRFWVSAATCGSAVKKTFQYSYDIEDYEVQIWKDGQHKSRLNQCRLHKNIPIRCHIWKLVPQWNEIERIRSKVSVTQHQQYGRIEKTSPKNASWNMFRLLWIQIITNLRNQVPIKCS